MEGLLAATIFVEGKDDLEFVRQCMQRWGFGGRLVAEKERKNATGKICPRFIDGNEDQLFSKGALSILKEAIRLSEKTLFLLDADKDPCGKRKAIERLAKERGLDDFDMGSVFLVPDNKNPGNLETLQISISRHQAVHGCFDRYLECVQSVGRYKLPDDKDKVYAYTKAVCGEKPRECNYFDSQHWRTDSPLLQPLEAFLKKRLPVA